MCAAAQLHPDALDSLSPGLIVGGVYQLTRPLGAAATARVWEAEQLRSVGRVAIKFLDPSLLHDETARACFEREARALCEMRSPYIVQVQDHGSAGDVPFLVMELLEGEDLARLLAREHALSLEDTTDIIEQLCGALDYAHRAGFVPRDVKPESVFVIQASDGSKLIKLLDSAIVERLGGKLSDAPHYLSPEQISRPAQVDVRSDTWAVGVTAYRLLVGRLPFQAEHADDASGLYESILAGLYQPATDLRPELPKELDDWFAQMLAVAPDARFSSLRAASAALASISRSRAPTLSAAVQPRSHVQATTFHDTSTRRPGTALLRLGLMALGALLAAAGVFLWAARAERPNTKPARNQLQIETRAPKPAAKGGSGPNVASCAASDDSGSRC